MWICQTNNPNIEEVYFQKTLDDKIEIQAEFNDLQFS